MDLAVKCLYFRTLFSRLCGGDHIEWYEENCPGSLLPYEDEHNFIAMYEWMMLARNGDRMRANVPTDNYKVSLMDYHNANFVLAHSMMNDGFPRKHAVPIDKNGELLDGSHRVACALAMGFTTIWVEKRPDQEVWAPAWDRDWFVFNRMPHNWTQQAAQEFERLR